MPLVRIDIIEGRTPEEIKILADSIQQVMVNYFAAPENDRYQVIQEHKPDLLIVQDSGLGFKRTEKIVVLQITQQGRSTRQKVAMYNAMCEQLEKIGVPPEDVVISVAENTRADWSFGMGRAQFLKGEL